MQIGEVSQRAGISARMLRHYDELGIVSPSQRTAGGYREYSAQDIRRLFQVESLRSLGMSLRDAQRALDEPDFAPAGLVRELVEATQQRIQREQELLRRLRGVEDSTDWEDVLQVIALLRGLQSEDPSRRQRSALATAAQDAPSARVLAQALLDEPDPNVAGALRWALRRAEGDALPVLAPALEFPDAGVRRRAVGALADIAGAEATRLLVTAVADDDPSVRDVAALALAARGEPSAIPVLVAMVVSGSHDVDAGEALSGYGRDDDIAALLRTELERDGTTAAARLRLAQALAELRGPVVDAVLSELAADADRAVRLTAAAVRESRRRS